MTHIVNSSNRTSFSSASAEIEKQVQEGSLIRVLSPRLQQKIERALVTDSQFGHYVIREESKLYISLGSIEDQQQRQRLYHLLHQYQIGEKVDLSMLPTPIRQILQPDATRTERSLHVIVTGGVAGIFVGVLAMAISILILDVIELATGTTIERFAGMEIRAVAFILFSIIGWSTAAVFLSWRNKTARQHIQ